MKDDFLNLLLENVNPVLFFRGILTRLLAGGTGGIRLLSRGCSLRGRRSLVCWCLGGRSVGRGRRRSFARGSRQGRLSRGLRANAYRGRGTLGAGILGRQIDGPQAEKSKDEE